MGLFIALMKLALPLPKFEKCESFAFIGPHPDDIEVACGPTIDKLVKMGKRVCFIVCTNGQYGSNDPAMTKENMVKIREKEAIAAAKVLGVTDVRFMGFPDGGEYDLKKMKDKIAVELVKFKPDIVFTADPHLRSEIHPDHLQAGRAGELAFFYSQFSLMMRDLGIEDRAYPKAIAYYYTDRPNYFFKIKKENMEARIKALETHESQFIADDEMKKNFNYLKLYFKITAFKHGSKRLHLKADGYRVMLPLHTHCAPEASDM
jgi:LmbE family N-acetylglucosaminyl deacetylase